MVFRETRLGSGYSSYLQRYAGKICHVIPYPGNSGDGLIVAGTVFELDRLGIRTTCSPDKADFLLYPGGTPALWKEGLEIWADYWKRFPAKPFIIGPATFQFAHKEWIDLVLTLGRSVSAIFAREPLSFAALETVKLPEQTYIGLASDAAFFLRQSPLIASLKEAVSDEYTLFSFRRDHEMTPNSRWISIPGIPPRVAHLWRSCRQQRDYKVQLQRALRKEIPGEPKKVIDAALLSFDYFLQTVMRAAAIHTNRLHVMILAALLEKPVFAYDVAFPKLRSVYDYSMHDFKTVRFCY